ncbi:deoxyribose-phosphate aldolase [Alishewanella tabrizica]|uniref:Deoxyribose-phosphate aldolase n=1 Tax=Alishewanella tabrizica TaxID=671278 RepID=A0ABQ2WU15_9ALTE|nr:deoxyribose-phosphate aldolase [Alishewanella tabrizica]GGW68173.1 deoxyribose-phosphate aldolase [Alishewanella tabrizica]
MTSSLRLQQLVTLLDVTRLNETDEPQDVQDWLTSLPQPPVAIAAFCVYPQFLQTTAAFAKSSMPTAALATVVNFPEGDQPIERVLSDVAKALALGATEIDCVMPYNTLLKGDEKAVLAFLTAVRAACGEHCLKVIIESGELVTAQQITKATELVIASGADFVKTSTGKVPVGVTLEAARIILTSIAAADRIVGFKASGGLKTIEQALAILEMFEQITGQNADAKSLRIGASALLNELVQELSL